MIVQFYNRLIDSELLSSRSDHKIFYLRAHSAQSPQNQLSPVHLRIAAELMTRPDPCGTCRINEDERGLDSHGSRSAAADSRSIREYPIDDRFLSEKQTFLLPPECIIDLVSLAPLSPRQRADLIIYLRQQHAGH